MRFRGGIPTLAHNNACGTGAILKTQITFYMWITTHAFSMCEDHVIVNVSFVICVPFL